MTSWYYLDRDNNTGGPATLADIDERIARGELPSDPLLVAVGGTEWQPRSSVPRDASAPRPSASATAADAAASFKQLSQGGLWLANTVARALDVLRRILTPGRLQTLLDGSATAGHYAVLIGAGLTVVYGLFIAVRAETFSLVLSGLALLVMLAVAQFTAARFLGAASTIVANTPSRVGSSALLDSVALLSVALAFAALLGGFGLSMQMGNVGPMLPLLILALNLLGAATLALHPGTANVSVAPASAGEEAIGFFSSLLKGFVMLVPLTFALLAGSGVLVLLAAFFGERSASAVGGSLMDVTPGLGMLGDELGGGAIGFFGTGLIVAGCALPFLAYLIFVGQHLIVDLLRAALSLPREIERVRETLESR